MTAKDVLEKLNEIPHIQGRSSTNLKLRQDLRRALPQQKERE